MHRCSAGIVSVRITNISFIPEERSLENLIVDRLWL